MAQGAWWNTDPEDDGLMKKFTAYRKMITGLLIGLCLLTVCAVSAAAGEAGWEVMRESEKNTDLPEISYEDYPHFDGSLACVPLMEKLAVKITGCTQQQAEGILYDFSNTNPCYEFLAEGERDIIIAYEPSRETVESIPDYNDLQIKPVGKDALVFIVNKDNPVDSLTAAQLYDIYTGKVTNWKEVGGADIPIAVFRRPEKSGSQTMMRKLLMGDADMTAGESEEVAGMEGIITRLKSYDNSANAIGYSVYYYASQMYEQPDLKFLKVEGVGPSEATIGDGTYPFINEFFCAVGKNPPKNAADIMEWLCSSGGQQFIEECGYVPFDS